MWYANDSKSHKKEEIVEAAKKIMEGDESIHIVTIDSGISGYDDIHIYADSTPSTALNQAKSSFSHYLDVSIEEIEAYQEAAINPWTFNVMSKEEIEGLVGKESPN